MWVYIYKEEQEWQPGENTLAYLPLKENSNDLSWNWNNGTDTNITYSNWKAVFNNSGTSRILISGISWTQRTFTLNMIVQITSLSWYQHIYRQWYYNNGYQDNSWCWLYWYDSTRLIASTNRQLTGYIPDWNEHLYTFVVNTGSIKFYVDGTLQYTWTVSIWNVSSAKFCLWGRDYALDEWLRWTMREVIVESTLRTDAEILELAQVYWFAS